MLRSLCTYHGDLMEIEDKDDHEYIEGRKKEGKVKLMKAWRVLILNYDFGPLMSNSIVDSSVRRIALILWVRDIDASY